MVQLNSETEPILRKQNAKAYEVNDNAMMRMTNGINRQHRSEYSVEVLFTGVMGIQLDLTTC